MAIFSLLLKPASCYFVYQMYRERGGEYTFNIGRMLLLPPHPLVLEKAAFYSVPFTLSLVQLDSVPLSREADGPSLSHVCFPLLWSCHVLVLKYILPLPLQTWSPRLTAILPIMVLTQLLSPLFSVTQVFPLFHLLHLCGLVGSLWVSFPLCQPFLFLLWGK